MRELIRGGVMPILEIGLDPGESVCTESGEFALMTSSLALTASDHGEASGKGVKAASSIEARYETMSPT